MNPAEKADTLAAPRLPESPTMDALLPLLACPVTGETGLTFEGDPAGEGLIRSPSGRAWPVIGGVPRLLPPDLLAPFLQAHFPDFTRRHPEVEAWLRDAPPAEPAVLETLLDYSFQHVDLADLGMLVDDWRATWDRFQPGLPPESFSGETVLEVGCGEGRHAWLVSQHAKCLVGLDLSRGVEVARRRDPRPNAFYVQGDLRRAPFRPEVFDAFYSNGVLHHTPVPEESFQAAARLVRRGGRAAVWVYGLDEMRLTYRLSHLTFLRPLTNRLPRGAQMALATGMTAAVEVGLWTPARVLERLGREDLAKRIPYHDAAHREWKYKQRRMFDRLNPPITHYITREALERWFAGWSGVEILNADGQGWSARGRR